MADTHYDQLLAHLVGDYCLQTHWQAQEKTRSWLPAAVHGISYALPFVALTRSPARLAAIAASHAVIDRYRLAKYLVWLKEQGLAPTSWCYPWSEAGPTGYPSDVPDGLALALMILADNTCHLLINRLVLRGSKRS